MASNGEEKALRAKLQKLVVELRETQAKTYALVEEIDALLGGAAGIGAQLKAAYLAFDAVWCSRYAPGQTGRYVWAYMKDAPQMKRLIKGIGSEELGRRMVRYLANDDAFYTKARHPFALFVASINTHASAPFEGAESDAEHTRRRMEEMRRV